MAEAKDGKAADGKHAQQLHVWAWNMLQSCVVIKHKSRLKKKRSSSSFAVYNCPLNSHLFSFVVLSMQDICVDCKGHTMS